MGPRSRPRGEGDSDELHYFKEHFCHTTYSLSVEISIKRVTKIYHCIFLLSTKKWNSVSSLGFIGLKRRSLAPCTISLLVPENFQRTRKLYKDKGSLRLPSILVCWTPQIHYLFSRFLLSTNYVTDNVRRTVVIKTDPGLSWGLQFSEGNETTC